MRISLAQSNPQPPPDIARIKNLVPEQRFLDCIHCGLCLSSCPTYAVTGSELESPRGRIYLMRALTEGRLTADTAVEMHLSQCLNCRACETACPSGVRYHEILEPIRHQLAQTQRPQSLPWVQRFAMRSVLPFRNRLRWGLAPLRAINRLGGIRIVDSIIRRLPKSFQDLYDSLPDLEAKRSRLPEFLPAIGKRRASVALFVGCVADGVYPRTTVATAKVLQRNGCDVSIPQQQVCCGALDFHDAEENRARHFAKSNLRAFDGQFDAIISNAAGCGAMMKEYPRLFERTEDESAAQQFSARVKDVCEFLVDLGLEPPTFAAPIRATYHDACHLRHAQGIVDQPRKILSQIPQLKLIPLPESELCCGAAGSYTLTQPEMARQLGRRKAENIANTGAEIALTGNVGCIMQISKHLRTAGPNIRVAHPVDLLWQAYGGQS